MSTDGTGVDLSFSDAELEAERERITDFIEAQLEAAGAERAILGLSGGIDSTTTAYLAVEALGPDRVRGLIMPGAVSLEDNMSDAERVARDLDIEYDVVEIDPVVDVFLEGYPDAADDTEAVGNARARARAVFNYLVANHENGLVLGTGNRTEALVGYFTKYGDGAVDCHPIGDLYKMQVRQLARDLGVPEDLVTKTPTAGLWEGQTDEGELGMAYGTLDAVLALAVDGELPPSAAARIVGVDRSEVERILDLHRRTEHKRRTPPSPSG